MSKLRHISIFILIFILNSCSSNSVYRELFEGVSLLFSSPKDLTDEQIESVPYASMQARIGKTPNTLIVLEQVNNDIFKWTSSNLIKIYTKKGFIVRFSGLGNELENIDLDPKHPVNSGIFEINNSNELTSFYTFDNPKLFRLPVKTKFSFLREEEITILGEVFRTKVFAEESSDNLINWRFRNLYWVDDYNYIIKSKQHFTPRNPAINLKVTKKYKKPDD
jgi:hypothetical protein